MLSHLANCHGEWTLFAVVLAHVPLVGVWLRSRRTPDEDRPA